MKNVNKQIFNAQPIASVNSAAIDAQSLFAMTAIAKYSDVAAAGTLKLQGSNDTYGSGNLPQDFVPVNWVDVPSATVEVTAGGTVTFAANNLCYRWLRLNWVRSAGAGTFSAYINAQGM